MTVAEAIAKLQALPPDLKLYLFEKEDYSWRPLDVISPHSNRYKRYYNSPEDEFVEVGGDQSWLFGE